MNVNLLLPMMKDSVMEESMRVATPLLLPVASLLMKLPPPHI